MTLPTHTTIALVLNAWREARTKTTRMELVLVVKMHFRLLKWHSSRLQYPQTYNPQTKLIVSNFQNWIRIDAIFCGVFCSESALAFSFAPVICGRGGTFYLVASAASSRPLLCATHSHTHNYNIKLHATRAVDIVGWQSIARLASFLFTVAISFDCVSGLCACVICSHR